MPRRNSCDALGASRMCIQSTADCPRDTRDTGDHFELHMQQLDEELAVLLRVHQDAVRRLAAVPVDSAQQITSEVGPTAMTFPTAQAPRVLGGRLSGARGERRHRPQPPRPKRNPPNAPTADSGRAATSHQPPAACARSVTRNPPRANRPPSRPPAIRPPPAAVHERRTRCGCRADRLRAKVVR
jgi:hypothetical protein